MSSVAFYLLLLISLTAVAISPTTSATTIGGTYSSPGSVSGSVLLMPDRFAEKIVSMNIRAIFILVLAVTLPRKTSATAIGVTYTSPGAVGIFEEVNVSTIVAMKIPAVRLLDPEPEMIRAFTGTTISLFLSLSNGLVQMFASNRSHATLWVDRHVIPFYPRTKISIISLGNDAISYMLDVSPLLLEAMENLQSSLDEVNATEIRVSTTLTFSKVVDQASPPSAARFRQPNGEVIIRPILQFIQRTNSYLLINLYPYNVFRSGSVPMGLAIFDDSPWSFVDDFASGVRYRNSFDLMVDSLISSMKAMGHPDLPLVVAETGWPKSGSQELATFAMSQAFLKGLVRRLRREGRESSVAREVYLLFEDYKVGFHIANNEDSTSLVSAQSLMPVREDQGQIPLSYKVGAGVLVTVIACLLPLLAAHLPTVEDLQRAANLLGIALQMYDALLLRRR